MAAPPVPFPTLRVGVTLLATLLAACGLGDGERFGRSGARPGQLRLHVATAARELDPPRAESPLERALATQLFATLLDERGGLRLATRVTPGVGGRTLSVELTPDARFSDGSPLDADAVVWSWRRALYRSTGTRDLAPLGAIAHGAELAEGRLLRVARRTSARGAPYTQLGEAPAPLIPFELDPGATVRVLDTNERRPCCGGSVTLRREPDAGDALGVLHANDVGTVIGERILERRVFLLVRAPSGASGWAEQGQLATHVSPASLVRVVDRGDGSAALRAGPDDDAPVRQALADDAIVEVLGDAEGWLHAVDLASGLMGFLPERAVESLRGERQWMFVAIEAEDGGEPRRGWVPLRDLAFHPGALGVRALDARTLEIDCAGPVEGVVRVLSHAALAAVPPTAVATHGRAWTEPDHIVTSGAFTRGPNKADRVVLLKSAASFEARRARLERVEVVPVANAVAALHLYRAGELDVLLDVPAELAGALSRATDFVAVGERGGLVAPEVRGLSLEQLDLRDVEVMAP